MIVEFIQRYLRDAGASFRHIQHPLAVDASHLAQTLGISGHRVAKCLAVQAGAERLIVALPASSYLDLQAVGRLAGHEDDVKLLDERELATLFPGCEVGAAPPFGGLWRVPLVMDVALERPGPIYMRGGTHEDVIAMEQAEFADLEDPLVAAVSFEGEALAGEGFQQGALGPQ